jgi:DNA replication protein DnaC
VYYALSSMANDITRYLSLPNGAPREGIFKESLASKVWALGTKLSEEKIKLLEIWLKKPSAVRYRQVKKIIAEIKGADKLLRKELEYYPYDSEVLLDAFNDEIDIGDAEWTRDQLKAARRFFRWIHKTSPFFRINGFGGTGKTTLTVELAIMLLQLKLVNKIIFAAPTHKELGVIESRFMTRCPKDLQLKVEFMSVHKLLGFAPEFNEDGEMIFVKKLPVQAALVDLVFVDEISMISKDQANEILAADSAKIVLSGDFFQLPPVGETFSILCKDEKIVDGCNLRIKVRNTDANVHKFFAAVRNWISEDITPKWSDYACSKVQFCMKKPDQEKVKTEWMQAYLKSARNGESPIILTWTRKQRDEYNIYAREKLLGKNLPRFVKGDPLLLSDFYKIPETEETPLVFHSSEQIVVTQVFETTFKTEEFKNTFPVNVNFQNYLKIERDYLSTLEMIRRAVGISYQIWLLQVKKTGEAVRGDNNEYQLNIMHEQMQEQWRSDCKLISKYITNLRNSLHKTYKSEETINRFVIIPMWQEYHRVMQDPFAGVERGMAGTIHSSQGSTYKRVWIDASDVLKNRKLDEGKRCFNTGATRAAKSIRLLFS